jgi:hypothetical protein
MSNPASSYGNQENPSPPPRQPYGPGHPASYGAASAPEAQDSHAASFFAGLFDFGFTKFITLSFLKFIYVLVVVFMGVVLLGCIVLGFAGGAYTGLAALILGPIVALLYLIWIRMGMEFLAVVFRMAGDIRAIRERQLPI